jgi:hypothetical protein
MSKVLRTQSHYNRIYVSFLSCGQPDDAHVRSKHVVDLWTKCSVVF